MSDVESTYPVPADDPEMVAAMQRARATFPDFIRELDDDSRRLIPVISSSLIKAYFADEDQPEEGEHMWVEVEEWDDDSVTGTLLSEPGHVKCVRAGETVRIVREQLSDWLYVTNDVAHGAHTVQVLRRRMSPAERSEHDSLYPFGFQEG